MIYQGSARYPVTEIVVHCSATWAKWWENKSTKAQVAEFRRWHMRDRGWRDIGYHWVVGRDGEVVEGRAMTEIGAGVAGHNRGVIHICLVGGKDKDIADALFLDNFTLPQQAALRKLIRDIHITAGPLKLAGHNEYAAKACPCFNVQQWAGRENVTEPQGGLVKPAPTKTNHAPQGGFWGWLAQILKGVKK